MTLDTAGLVALAHPIYTAFFRAAELAIYGVAVWALHKYVGVDLDEKNWDSFHSVSEKRANEIWAEGTQSIATAQIGEDHPAIIAAANTAIKLAPKLEAALGFTPLKMEDIAKGVVSDFEMHFRRDIVAALGKMQKDVARAPVPVLASGNPPKLLPLSPVPPGAIA